MWVNWPLTVFNAARDRERIKYKNGTDICILRNPMCTGSSRIRCNGKTSKQTQKKLGFFWGGRQTNMSILWHQMVVNKVECFRGTHIKIGKLFEILRLS